MDATSSDHRSQSSSQPTFRSSVINKAVKVERFEVSGLQRTKESIVWRELPETLVGANVSLKDLVQALQDSHDRLSSLGIFDGIDIAINAGAQSQDGCTIAVRLQESSMFGFRAGTYVQGHEATMESSLNLNNSMGRAEQAAFTLEYGSQRTNLWSATVTLPRPQGLSCIADVRLHQTFNDKSQWSSYTERLRGIIATVATEDGRHAFSYELGWQRLADPSQCASASVARQLGDHVKSAVKYTFRTDTFDDFLFPRHGWGVRASTELAGLGPDARLLRYLRHQVAGRMAFPVNSAATLHLEGLAGILVPWGASNIVKTSITDRFFLGGIAPEGLRGFRYKSVGPRDVRRPQRSQVSYDTLVS
jgi:outer membrane protein insertion porin family